MGPHATEETARLGGAGTASPRGHKDSGFTITLAKQGLESVTWRKVPKLLTPHPLILGKQRNPDDGVSWYKIVSCGSLHDELCDCWTFQHSSPGWSEAQYSAV